MAGEDGDDAGYLLLVHGLLHERAQAFETLGGEADALRAHGREVGGGRWGGLLGVGERDAEGNDNAGEEREGGLKSGDSEFLR